MPDDVAEIHADLKREKALIFASGEAIVAKYQHRDRMPRRVARRLDRKIARLKEIHAEIAAIVDAWGDDPELPYLVIPQWENVARAVELVGRRVDLDPASRANADRVGALIRDRFDGLGLRITDPETLYVSLVAIGVLVELTRNGRDSDGVPVDDDVLHIVALCAETFTAGIIPWLPEEALHG